MHVRLCAPWRYNIGEMSRPLGLDICVSYSVVHTHNIGINLTTASFPNNIHETLRRWKRGNNDHTNFKTFL